ncbi:MAG: ABC transporter permease [Synergistaceae bacterium]|jgi:ribose transport system permease protein|nr:ABC transporter permease [Synergistaceae bacterium]
MSPLSAASGRDLLLRKARFLLLLSVIAALFFVGDRVSSGFLTWRHAGVILRTASFVGVAAIGQTLVVLTGGIDLSVGALITMGNVFTCMFVNGQNGNTLHAVLLVFLIGAMAGCLSGFGVSVLHISPMVMTMATGTIVTGITLVASHGSPKGQASPLLRVLGVGSRLGLPVTVWLWLALSIVVVIVLRRTTFGRKIYCVGAGETAALFSGIDVNSVRIRCYAISGVTAMLVGVMMAGYTETAFLGIGTEYTLSSITAVVIGGTSMAGGRGSYTGTVLGAILLVLIESLLTVMNIQEAGKKIVGGLVILAIITLYYRAEKRG